MTLGKAEPRYPEVGVGTRRGGLSEHAFIPQTRASDHPHFQQAMELLAWSLEGEVRSAAGEAGNWVQDNEIHTATINKMLRNTVEGRIGR